MNLSQFLPLITGTVNTVTFQNSFIPQFRKLKLEDHLDDSVKFSVNVLNIKGIKNISKFIYLKWFVEYAKTVFENIKHIVLNVNAFTMNVFDMVISESTDYSIEMGFKSEEDCTL